MLTGAFLTAAPLACSGGGPLESLIKDFFGAARADGGAWLKEQEPVGWEALGVAVGADGKPLQPEQQPNLGKKAAEAGAAAGELSSSSKINLTSEALA